MLGVNCDSRESVHGYMEVAWRQTLGWKQSDNKICLGGSASKN